MKRSGCDKLNFSILATQTNENPPHPPSPPRRRESTNAGIPPQFTPTRESTVSVIPTNFNPTSRHSPRRRESTIPAREFTVPCPHRHSHESGKSFPQSTSRHSRSKAGNPHSRARGNSPSHSPNARILVIPTGIQPHHPSFPRRRESTFPPPHYPQCPKKHSVIPAKAGIQPTSRHSREGGNDPNAHSREGGNDVEVVLYRNEVSGWFGR